MCETEITEENVDCANDKILRQNNQSLRGSQLCRSGQRSRLQIKVGHLGAGGYLDAACQFQVSTSLFGWSLSDS